MYIDAWLGIRGPGTGGGPDRATEELASTLNQAVETPIPANILDTNTDH